MKKFIFCIMLFVSLTLSLFGTEIFVDGNNIQGPWLGTELNPYQYIHVAITNSNDGDVITVHEGEYVENLEIENKSLTLRNANWESGNWNPEDFIINGDYNGHVIEIYNVDIVIIQGFTIKNSGTSYTSSPYPHTGIYDSGVYAHGSDIIEIQHNKFTNNYCGVYMNGIMNNAEISSNTFDDLLLKYIFWHGSEYLYTDLIIENNYFSKQSTIGVNDPIDCWYNNIEILNNEFSIHISQLIDVRFTDLTTINKNNFNISGSSSVLRTTKTDLIMNNNNIIYGEGATGTVIQLWTDIPKTAYFTENLIVGGTTGFWFEDRVSTNASTQGFFRNNTILSCGTAFYFEHTNISGANGITEFKNNIVWDVNNSFYFEGELDTPITIEYSCIEGGVPNDPSIINGVGNIDINPDLTLDYHLSEDSVLLIDAADPDTDGDGNDWEIDEDDRDIDGSRKDMGCYPYLHEFDTKHFSPGWQWPSFPVLTQQFLYTGSYEPLEDEMYEQAYNENGYNGFLQVPFTGELSINGFNKIEGKREFLMDIQYIEESFVDITGFGNMLFRQEGYKIFVGGTNTTTLTVDGDRLPANHTIDGALNSGEYHWLGFWIPRTQNMIESFGEGPDGFWQYVKKVKSEDWFYSPAINPRGGDPTYPVAISAEGLTLEYGKTYLVLFNETVEGFHWTDTSITVETEKKAEPESFTYTEKADYEAIDVYNIPPNVTEIGVFEDDICVGAVVVEDTCAQILVYSDNANRDPIPFTFEFVAGRGFSTSVKDYQVLDWETGKFESRSIFSGRQEYSILRFGDEDEPEDNTLLTPQLHGNYPNPFNPTTTIEFSLVQTSQFVTLEIFNIKGQKVKTLYKGIAEEGKHSVTWEGKDTNGKSVSTGIYFYKLKTGKKEISRKMLLLK